MAEPAAARLADAIATRLGGSPTVHRRPSTLLPLLADLQTYSLFDSAKVVVAVESAALAELSAAAALFDDLEKALPVEAADGETLSGPRRDAAIRLLRALRLLQLDPYRGAPGDALAGVPDWALAGAGRGRKRAKPAREKLRSGLVELLAAAREAELAGRGEGEAEELAALLQRGLPEGHCLILAESSVAREHPAARVLAERGALVDLGRVEQDRQGWHGLTDVAAELERETGVAIRGDALRELARRTLRSERGGRPGTGAARADSTARLAAEYRKLAAMSPDAPIAAELVREVVEDRGQEDAWAVLDAVGAGRSDEALARLARLLAAADDPVGDRLAFFSLLAGFARQMAAVGEMLDAGVAQPGEGNYQRFKQRVAPKLQADPPGGGRSPVAGLHPFRLHRAYLAASRLPAASGVRLPARVLETELAMKGDSRAPEAALAAFVAGLAAAIGRP
ncbi:MAG: hypothetical protein R3325_02060 [Thermoanaerobaculia bacterium]|nr:hypothetical protein [Thermoanaerobaculia bacterium]